MITQILAQLITEAVPLVDKVATASDRWLFLAALFIIISGGSCAIRWLIKSIETQNAEHAKERATLVTALATKDLIHEAERGRLIAEIKAEHAECRSARKEDQAQFISNLEKKDTALNAHTIALQSLAASLDRRDMHHS